MSLYGPAKGKQYSMLPDSKVLETMGTFSFREELEDPNFHIYGDPSGYSSSDKYSEYLRCPYKGFLTLEEVLDNRLWAEGLESMKWGFEEVNWNFDAVSLDMENNVGTGTIGRLYRVGTILSNCLTCLNQESFTNILSVTPPTIEQYINREL